MDFLKKFKPRITWKVKSKQLDDLKDALSELTYETVLRNEKYLEQKRLTKFGYKSFSQNEEDGILEEIFNRIGTTNQVFVEFGVGNGLENNTVFLLMQGWTGFWIEGSKKLYKELCGNTKIFTSLTTRNDFITAENANDLFQAMNVPREFNLLSIDIDGNDYWIWKTLEYNPHVVIVEYNAILGPTAKWVMKYNPFYSSNDTSQFGASLKSFELLGKEKGYSLVGCNINGANAFFVRNDLLESKFSAPYTSENHYEPPRNFSLRRGHRRVIGEFCIQ